jgi:hypothetical protein
MGRLVQSGVRLLPNAAPMAVELLIKNLPKVLSVRCEIKGPPPRGLSIPAAASFLALAYSSPGQTRTPHEFSRLAPTIMADTWQVHLPPTAGSLPRELPYQFGADADNNHCVGVLTALKSPPAPKSAPFLMPCKPPPRAELARQRHALLRPTRLNSSAAAQAGPSSGPGAPSWAMMAQTGRWGPPQGMPTGAAAGGPQQAAKGNPPSAPATQPPARAGAGAARPLATLANPLAPPGPARSALPQPGLAPPTAPTGQQAGAPALCPRQQRPNPPTPTEPQQPAGQTVPAQLLPGSSNQQQPAANRSATATRLPAARPSAATPLPAAPSALTAAQPGPTSVRGAPPARGAPGQSLTGQPDNTGPQPVAQPSAPEQQPPTPPTVAAQQTGAALALLPPLPLPGAQ